MKSTQPLLFAVALLPALVQAHPGHPALPGHEHAAGFLDSPASGFLAGLAVLAVAAVWIAARKLPRRSRTTAMRRR